MSGNFTQRGEPAIMDKWTRSRIAVTCGVDLVLELPFGYAVNSAEYFACGGVSILEGLGCVTHLGFGAEKGSLAELMQAAGFLADEPEVFRLELKRNLEQGQSYARARQLSLEKILGSELTSLFLTPNNILALEYLKQLKKLNSSIKPIMVNRKGAGYFDEAPSGEIASATAIRTHIERKEWGKYVPGETLTALQEAPEVRDYFRMVQAAVLQRSEEELKNIFSVGEGLENRLLDHIRRAEDLEGLVEAASSKRYPKTRIRRILCQNLMGLTALEEPYYARILAAGPKGTLLLRHAKKTARIPLITNINRIQPPPMLKTDITASDMYNLLTGKNLYENCDYVRHPYIRSE